MTPRQFGRYRVDGVLGAGAMGQVYEGFDPEIERRVAIKTIRLDVLSEDMAAEFRTRFRAETRAAGRLQHPNIVALYDAGQDEGLAYLVMEFVAGEDLKHRLDRGESFTVEQAVALLRQLLAALATAHRQGVVHRDVKPANILVTRDERIKLADFGVARLQEGGDATRTRGAVVGTVRYASPEQLRGEAVDGRSDLFSCGVVLYRLLAGRPPFDGPNELAVMQQVLNASPAPPSTLNPAVPPALDAVVLRALEKDPQRRPADAEAFAMALLPFAAVEPGSTIRLGAAAADRPRRRPWLIALAVLLVGTAAVAGWWAWRPKPPAIVRSPAFDGLWSGSFVCGERIVVPGAASAPGAAGFSERIELRIDGGRLSWARKRGSISETMLGQISAGGEWVAEGRGIDTGNGNGWLTSGRGVVQRNPEPIRLKGELAIATPDGKRVARRCTLDAVRTAPLKG